MGGFWAHTDHCSRQPKLLQLLVPCTRTSAVCLGHWLPGHGTALAPQLQLTAGEGENGVCADPMASGRQGHGLPTARSRYLWVLGWLWAPSLASSPAGAARLSGLAPGWAPNVGASGEARPPGALGTCV